MKRSPQPDREPLGQAPPHAIEAEMSVLGAMLLDKTAVAEAAGLLTAEDFYRDAHAWIFRAMVHLNQRGEPVDIITLQNALESAGALEGIGTEYLMQLTDIEFTTANVGHYAKIVSDLAILRRVIEAAIVTARKAYDRPADVETFASAAVTRLLKAGETKQRGGYLSLRELLPKFWEKLQMQREEGSDVPGLSTGFVDLDRKTGGFKPGDLVIVGARPSMGKTAWLCNFLTNTAKRGERVSFASLEMTREQIVLRLLCSEARVDSRRVEAVACEDVEWHRLSAASTRLYLENFLMDDTGGLTVPVICSRARRLAASGPVAAVVVDYLQEAASEDAENRAVEVGRQVRAFKALAKELNCVVVVLSQLSRAVEKREDKRPIMADLLESGTIEASADIVLGLYRPAYYAGAEGGAQTAEGVPEEAELIVLKNRKGAVGMVKLNYFPHWTKFDNREDRPL